MVKGMSDRTVNYCFAGFVSGFVPFVVTKPDVGTTKQTKRSREIPRIKTPFPPWIWRRREEAA